MWRWIGIACLVYGLSSLWLLFAHRPAAGPAEPFAPGGPPPGVQLPAAIDFEGPFPPPITRPQTETEVVELAAGGHALDWRLPPEGPRVHTLALPMRPQPGATRLVLELRANQQRELMIGVREADGSIYLAPRRVGQALAEEAVPLESMRLAEFTEDENGRLDAVEATAVVIVCPELRMLRNRQGPALITLDNLRFE